MDSHSKEVHKHGPENEALAQKKLPIETINDYFERHGAEPSAVKIDIAYESPEEALRVQERERHQRRMELARFVTKEGSAYVVGCLLVVALTTVSVATLLDKTASPESQAWARATLTSVGTAIGGYLFGKSSSS